ncbi:MAG: tyrosine-type recombinase/integrase [Lachnospiraceae bacterium]|nr:tyrosine-type recombinase/integrase [Lachnospiraceae bacterium]
MNIAQPIREMQDLKEIKDYYRRSAPNIRNELLVIIGLNTALRISDILSLTWEMVYDFKRKKYLSHIFLVEQKTGKSNRIYLNETIITTLDRYKSEQKLKGREVVPEQFLFCHSNKNVAISRVQAFRIIKTAAKACGIQGVICCHSLRKTFGYHAWQQGVSPALLMNIYNHSSYQVTRRYLGIEQDDRDRIFMQIKL